MSSDRLFLDQVGRHQSLSPLHRHAHTTMHPLPAPSKPDISTLQRIGHFYFALTMHKMSLTFVPTHVSIPKTLVNVNA